MKIDIHQTPEHDIFRDRRTNIIWFSFFLLLVCAAVAIGFYAVYSTGSQSFQPEDWALGLLVAASIGITIFGNRLQAYKALFPPQKEKLVSLRQQYPIIEQYCAQVEGMQRKFIRAEYEACVEYAEIQENEQEKSDHTKKPVYGPAENPNKKKP